MTRLNVLLFLFVLTTSQGRPLAAAEDFEGTPAENELIELLESVDEQYAAYWEKSRALQDDPEAWGEFRKTHDPAQECVPKLLAFEEQHRGTLAGLMALRRINDLAGRGGKLDSPSARGKREALSRLSNYIDKAELLILLGHLGRGVFEPRVADTLRTISDNENASLRVREYSKLALGRWMLDVRDSREYAERRLRVLSQGIELFYPEESHKLEECLEAIPVEVLTQAWQKDAVEILSEVAESAQEIFLPEVKKSGSNRHLLVCFDDTEKPPRRLADSAKASLFKETHLRLGRTAPDLEMELLSGEKWSMAEQQEKAVIIQFSHKTCGPCQRMYPDLRELQQQYGEQLSILSVMSDKERTDTEQSIADGDVTWDVHWEGHRGPIGKLWGVNRYPTVYVVDQTGKIAGVRLRGEELKKKIGELLN